MTGIDKEVLDIASKLDPNAPIIEIIKAVLATLQDPSPANLVADLELAVELIREFKDKLKGVHPSVLSLLKLLF